MKKWTLSFVFTLLTIFSFSQVNLDLKDELEGKLSLSEETLLDQADEFLQTREFLSALPLYDSLLKKFPDNNYLAYLLGTCYCYDAHKFTLAEINILRAKDFRQRLPDYDFFLGKAYYENDKFDQAIASFESY